MDELEAKRNRVFSEILKHRVELTAYARSLLGNYAAAEDAVQQAMLVVLKKFEQYQEGTSALGWCRAIVRLEVLRIKQHRQREQSLSERLLDDAIDAAFEEFQATRRLDSSDSWRQALEECLERVPQRGRDVLKSRFVDELNYQEIGERLGMSLESVRKSLFRIKKQVQDCVQARGVGTT